jgi:preprotein translocase subunit SecA
MSSSIIRFGSLMNTQAEFWQTETGSKAYIAQISYQRFFRRYLYLAGTSGTLREVADELGTIYGLQAVTLPNYRLCKRVFWGEKIYPTSELARKALIERIVKLYELGRPVLIGTNTIAKSEEVSHWLSNAGFEHKVLNAKQDKHEAEVIAKAGQMRSITVATNMAGRGTDILLGLNVSEISGLHIVELAKNDVRRIDRQLFGRCARQGDPGSVEAILSLQDPFFHNFYSETIIELLSKLCVDKQYLTKQLGKLIIRFPQLIHERKQRQIRKQVLKFDRSVESFLEFTGRFE